MWGTQAWNRERRWEPDHHPPLALARGLFGFPIAIPTEKEYLYLPHCWYCSRKQGGNMRAGQLRMEKWAREGRRCSGHV
jgi:hypothetical protein